jgi:hypothetical protein
MERTLWKRARICAGFSGDPPCTYRACAKLSTPARAASPKTSASEMTLKIATETFSERRTALLRRSLSHRVVPPGGTVHVHTAAEEHAVNQVVLENMLDEVHAMLRALTRG